MAGSVGGVWDADEVRELVGGKAAADAGCRVFGASRHRWKLAPPVAEDAVARFEHDHRCELPASYRSFLTAVSGGGAGPAYGLYTFGSERWSGMQEALDLLADPFPHTGPFEPSPERSVCSAHAPGEEDFSPCWFAGSLTLAEIGCGSSYRLVVTGPSSGQVWTDDLGCGLSLTPGPDFRTWYTTWLSRPRA